MEKFSFETNLILFCGSYEMFLMKMSKLAEAVGFGFNIYPQNRRKKKKECVVLETLYCTYQCNRKTEIDFMHKNLHCSKNLYCSVKNGQMKTKMEGLGCSSKVESFA